MPGDLAARAGDFWVTLETVGRAQLYANDLNSQAASGYWLANLSSAPNSSAVRGISPKRCAWTIWPTAAMWVQ